MRNTFFRIVVLMLSAMVLVSAGKPSSVRIEKPTVEQQNNPVAISSASPRFGWQIASGEQGVVQTQYRILVASRQKYLNPGKADLWDSGTVSSDRSAYVVYGGKPLKSRDEAYWKVIVTTNAGQAESAISSFGIALLDSTDFKAKWIGTESPEDILKGKTRVNARYLRKDFNLDKKVASARLYICGLGLYEAFINGEAVGDDIMKPTLSDYRKRVYYNTYDVTSCLTKGSNAIGVLLGNGRYGSMRINLKKPWPASGILHFGLPQLLMQLEVIYKDGSSETIVSDESWKVSSDGPVRSNNEFDGETYDSRKEFGQWANFGFDDSGWHKASLVDAPQGCLEAQPNPNIEIQERIKPVKIVRSERGYILDMGQNMVGRLQMNISGHAAGDTVKLRFAETLSPDGSLYTANLRSAEATDIYICSGPERVTWHPTFVYHGFRFVEVTGLLSEPELSDFEGQVFYDRMAQTGTFETSDAVINSVYHNAMWGIRGNYRGMPTDCPQRDERMGWLGDRATGCYGESFIFSNHLLYSKWLYDIEDSQNEAGSIPNVAPVYWEVRNDNMTWPAAYITAADMLYERFGDVRPIQGHYLSMRKWMRYMREKYLVDGIMTKDTYGDWCMPPESLELIHSKDPKRITDPQLMATAFYYRLLNMMEKFAPLAGHPEDTDVFRSQAEATLNSFNERFFNPETKEYSNNTVTANILPLYFGMVPSSDVLDVFSHIVDKTQNDLNGHVSVGVVGIQQLMRCLSDYGRADIALKLASDDTYPSWGYMAKEGATTIWELWNGNTADPAMNSGNHVMLLGDLVIWEYEYLGGIKATKPGYKEFSIKPLTVDGIEWVNCSYDSIYGKIVSNWKKTGGALYRHIEIPANTTALIYFPSSASVSVSGVVPAIGQDSSGPLISSSSVIDKAAIEKAGGRFVGTEGDYLIFSFGSGKYDFGPR